MQKLRRNKMFYIYDRQEFEELDNGEYVVKKFYRKDDISNLLTVPDGMILDIILTVDDVAELAGEFRIQKSDDALNFSSVGLTSFQQDDKALMEEK